jgi:hypothetical protein
MTEDGPTEDLSRRSRRAPLMKRRRRVQAGPLTLLLEAYHDRAVGQSCPIDPSYLAKLSCKAILQSYLAKQFWRLRD